MAALPINVLVNTGLVPSAIDQAAAAGGDTFKNNGQTIFYINNASAGPLNVTFGAVTDVAQDIGAGEERIMGPFKPEDFNDANGLVNVTYTDGVTTLTVAAIQI